MSDPDGLHVPPEMTVLVASDQQLTGQAIRVALTARGMDTCGGGVGVVGAQRRQIAQAIREHTPRVGLLVLERPEPLHLWEALALLRERDEVPWVVLTAHPEGPRWGALLEAGAHTVLAMDRAVEDLAHTLSTVAAGGPTMNRARRTALLADWEARDPHERSLQERLQRLSPLELEVLHSLAAGRQVQAIAEAGRVGVVTVRSQVKAILRKLEVCSQITAVALLQQATHELRSLGA